MSERFDDIKKELGTEEEEEKDDAEIIEEDEDVEEEEEEEYEVPEQFKGKDPKELIKMYQDLEKTSKKKPDENKARQDSEKKKQGDIDDLKEILAKQDFSKMDPQAFTEFILGLTDKRSEKRAKEIYEQKASIHEGVKTELNEATKEYPLLETNQEFRDLVLDVIESKVAKGETMSLMEASKKVSALMGAKEEKADPKDKKKKRPKTAIETSPKNGSGGGKETDEQRVIKGILGADKGGSNPLGGLGH